MDVMERLIITTQRDMSKLMSMMYLDIGKYSFEQTEEGISIDIDEDNPESLFAFIARFSTWLANESFLVNGDKYFKGHKYEEKWDIWKKDFRFMETYQDEFYRRTIMKRLEAFFIEFDDFYSLQLSLEGLFKAIYELTEVRMKLIEEHFNDEIHLDYIVLCMQLQKEKESIPSN